jgi:NADH-quinone oxidoreductase subunit C
VTIERLRAALGEENAMTAAMLSGASERPEIRAGREELLEVLGTLRRVGFERLEMVTAVDRGEVFELVYRLESRSLSIAVTVRVDVPREEPKAASACALWPAADWQEREVYDLFGIRFSGHPDLRRILLPDDWMGFPLRKDYADERIVRRPDYI